MARLLVVVSVVALCTALPLTEALSSGRAPLVVRAEDEEGSGSTYDDIFERIRQIIREGSEELGLPVLDPFQMLDPLGTTIEEDRTYEVTGSLRNAVITGLADFQAELIPKYTLGTLYLETAVPIKVPLLKGEGSYDFNSLLGEVVHLYGDGNFKLKISELEVTVVARIVPSFFKSKLSNLTTTINVDDFEFELDGLLEGGLVDGIFNLAVNEVAKIIFKEQKPVLEQFLADLLFDPVENVVSQYGFSDLICIILGC